MKKSKNNSFNLLENTMEIKALEYAVKSGSVSISALQRKFCIGYAKAGTLVDWMEKQGFVTSNDGSTERKVLISEKEFSKIQDGTFVFKENIKAKSKAFVDKYFVSAERMNENFKPQLSKEQRIELLWDKFFKLEEEKNYCKEKKVLEELVAQGEYDALNLLGDLYLYGLGENCDFDTAAKYYNEALLRGSIKAKYHIAAIYYYGLGVEKDYKKAFELYKDLAENNIAVGYKRMAIMYIEGYYVNRNFSKALDLLDKSLELSNKIKGVKKLKNIINGVKVLYKGNIVSHAILQRELAIGYPEADEIIIYLKKKGYVSASQELLISKEEYDNLFAS